MLLEIIRPGYDDVRLQLSSGIAILAGPNGVGKSILLEGIVNQQTFSPQQGRFPTVDQQQHGYAKLGDDRLTPVWLTTQHLSRAAIASGPAHNLSPSMPHDGASAEVLRLPHDQISDPQLRHLASLLTEDDRRILGSGSGPEKERVISAVRIRGGNLSIFSTLAEFGKYHYESARLKYLGFSQEKRLADLGTPPWDSFNRAFEQLGLPYRYKVSPLDETWIDNFKADLVDVTRMQRCRGIGYPLVNECF